jgi:hypothetical protein
MPFIKFPYVSLKQEQILKYPNHRPLSEDYVLYCIWTPVTEPTKPQHTYKKVHTAMIKLRPYMEDEEVNKHLSEYGELGFDDIPSWLKNEVKARNLIYEKRMPTEMEQWETVSDAREHRIMNKELTQQDYIAKYRKGKSITLIT